MVSINYSAREVCCKIVYYGPGLSGKTTNLQYIHGKVPQNTRGKLISLATEADRTLYFDFLPINIGTINDFQAKFQLYTVPGQVYYNATRKLVLRGVDGIVFVADSQPDKMDENIESLANLEENLREYGYNPEDIPTVIQFNKQDLPGVMSPDDLNAQLNKLGRPTFCASATVGNGVFDTLKMIIKIVLDKAKSGGTATASPAARVNRPAATAEPAAASASGSGGIAVQAPPQVTTQDVSQPTPSDAPAGAPAAQAPAMQPAQPAVQRPYPGSETERQKDRTAVPAGLGGTPDAAPAPTPTEGDSQGIETEQPQAQGESEQPNAGEAPSSVQMAPSLRKRDKKRGFFKRLFGIK